MGVTNFERLELRTKITISFVMKAKKESTPQEDDKGNRRRRTKTNRFEFDQLDNEEQRLLQQVRGGTGFIK